MVNCIVSYTFKKVVENQGIPLDKSCTNLMYKNEEISNPSVETKLVHRCDPTVFFYSSGSSISFYDITIFDENSEINSIQNFKKMEIILLKFFCSEQQTITLN